jgi:hypothetical protein
MNHMYEPVSHLLGCFVKAEHPLDKEAPENARFLQHPSLPGNL